jgi:hypothetical protein
MSRAHVDSLPRLRADPPGQDAAARKDKRVRAVSVDDGQLEITVERRG